MFPAWFSNLPKFSLHTLECHQFLSINQDVKSLLSMSIM
jgi:hypothetical protein